MRLALYYQSLLDSGAVATRAELARFLGEMGLRDIRIVEGIYESAVKDGIKVSLI